MSTRGPMPIATRLWGAGLLVAAAFCAWALFWPTVGSEAGEAAPGALPVYAVRAAPLAAAPNAADPAWARPLYFNDRRPRIAAVGQAGAGAANQGFEAVLTGIVRAPGLSLATLSPAGGKPTRVKLGDEVEDQPGWRLVSLTSRSATFRNGDRIQELRLEARAAAAAPPPPPSALPSPETSRPGDVPPPPAVPGITGQTSAAPAVTSSAPTVAPVPTPANASQDQQIQAIRRRIEDARRQMKPSDTPQPQR